MPNQSPMNLPGILIFKHPHREGLGKRDWTRTNRNGILRSIPQSEASMPKPHRTPLNPALFPWQFPRDGCRYAGRFSIWHHGLLAMAWLRENLTMKRIAIMVLHYAIAISVVLHLVSCIFLGESFMPETLH